MDRDRNSGKVLLGRLCRVFLTFVQICFAKFSLKWNLEHLKNYCRLLLENKLIFYSTVATFGFLDSRSRNTDI